MPSHVIKGDRVVVTSGFFKGQQGEVLRVIPSEQRVVVKGINLRTKHVKPTRVSPQGGIITREEPIHISKVSPLGADGKATRVRFVTKADGTKVRVAVRGGTELSIVRKGGSRKAGAAGATAPAGKKKTSVKKAPAKKAAGTK